MYKMLYQPDAVVINIALKPYRPQTGTGNINAANTHNPGNQCLYIKKHASSFRRSFPPK